LTPTVSPAFDQTNTDPTAAGFVVRPDLIGNPVRARQTAGKLRRPASGRDGVVRLLTSARARPSREGPATAKRSRIEAHELSGAPRE